VLWIDRCEEEIIREQFDLCNVFPLFGVRFEEDSFKPGSFLLVAYDSGGSEEQPGGDQGNGPSSRDPANGRDIHSIRSCGYID
jgi:hypothetical protein